MNDILPITVMQCGETALVDQLFGAPDVVQRLEELGLRPGTTVEMVQPGNPCIVRLAGGKLCFRHGDLGGVLVRPGVLT